MMDLRWRQVVSTALAESGAIVRSPGFLIAAFAPFVVAALGITALFYMSSQDPRVALVVSSDKAAISDQILEALSTEIGPSADKSKLRDQHAAHWVPVSADKIVDGRAALEIGKIPIGLEVNVQRDTKTVHLHPRVDPPNYIIDLVRAEANAAFLYEATNASVEFVIQGKDAQPAEDTSLSDQLIWLVTVLLAAASGALAAASTHALATAYLEQSQKSSLSDVGLREDFLGKLIGIGGAYATLALPWGIILSLGIGALAMSGDPALLAAIKETGVSAFDPLRLLLFLLCAPAGYVVFASCVLLIALRSKTAAAARSLAGPVSFFAVAPAPMALLFASNIGGIGYTMLSWFPLTAPAAIQLGFGTVDLYDLLIRSLFLVFIAIVVLRFALRRRLRLYVATHHKLGG
ncbi:MAG: hypothetical protein AAF720_13215 [Pseudomonadota bacterium]